MSEASVKEPVGSGRGGGMSYRSMLCLVELPCELGDITLKLQELVL